MRTKSLNNETFIHPTAVVDQGASLGSGVKVWHHCHIRSGATLEDGVSIGKDVYIDQGVSIGANSRIQNGVCIYSGVQIASQCFVGPHVTFTNDRYPRVGKKSWKLVETRLEQGASIGAGSIIICGVTIGSFALIGAGSLVSKSIPPFHLALGAPADCRKMICACGQTRLAADGSQGALVRECCRESLEADVLQTAFQVAESQS